MRRPFHNGVYVLEASIGLVKVGISGDVPRRVRSLQRGAEKAGVDLWLVDVLWRASIADEQALDAILSPGQDFLSRDAVAVAYQLGLPAPTEWHRPTKAARAALAEYAANYRICSLLRSRPADRRGRRR